MEVRKLMQPNKYFRLVTNLYLSPVIILLFSINGYSQPNNEFISKLGSSVRDFQVLMVIPVIDSNRVIDVCLSNTDLYNYVYKKYYSGNNKTFNEFLTSILTNSIKVPIDKLDSVLYVRIDQHSCIEVEYIELGLEFLKNKYFFDKGNRLELRNELCNEEAYNLIRIMFNNSYYIIEGEYQGVLVFYSELKKRDN